MVVVVVTGSALWVIASTVAPSKATTSEEVLIIPAFSVSVVGRVPRKLDPAAVTVKAVETAIAQVAVALSESVTVIEECPGYRPPALAADTALASQFVPPVSVTEVDVAWSLNKPVVAKK